MEITYKPVGVNETAEWGDYDHLMQRWEGLGKSMAKKLIREMRETKTSKGTCSIRRINWFS